MVQCKHVTYGTAVGQTMHSNTIHHSSSMRHPIQHKIDMYDAAKAHMSISQVVTSESWLMVSGTPHRNENMICRDYQMERHAVSRK